MGEPKRPGDGVERPTATHIGAVPTPPTRSMHAQPEPRTSTASLSGGPPAGGQPTAVMTPNARFGLPPEPRSEGGRTRSDSRQPLEFSEAQQIGRFGLIRELARGGMGQVFLARDTKLGRKVAIKFLLQADPTFVSRFVIEARATARCTHENIVTIFEVGEHQGLPYMVLEYLEGKTLSQLLENRMPVRAFVELMVPVVRALERAHEHGIVHRDLKPSNIFVTDRGSVKVLDFGVAKCFDGPQGQDLDRIAAPVAETRMMDAVEPEVTYVTFSGGGSLVGTLPYMSPEQWGADAVDHASDLWALGIMFWRALTGVHPAGTMAPDKLRARLTDLETPLASIGSRDPTIPPEVAAIVDRCLAKKKAHRYQSASQLLADLQAVLVPRGREDDDSPYRGLAAFGEGDARFFFGRSNEIRTALSQLEVWPLLAVIGPSGVGKSSFVHAGLVPAVRGTGGDWQIRVLRPGRSPVSSLANALGDVDPGRITEVVGMLREAPGQFGELLRNEAVRKRHRVLIVVDQLEELFTLSDDDDSRRTFLAALLAAADDPSAPVRVVLSMRADFLDRLAGHKQFLSELSRGLFFLSAPDVENLRETLLRPAEIAGYGFENTNIVDDMLQTASARGALPLLQFAATRLWDARDRNRKLLTVAAYTAMGGVGGAFARHADEISQSVPLQQQTLLRAVMTRLVTPEGTRAVVDHNELLSLAPDASDVQQIIDHLVRARLIHLHTDPTQGATVEIVHEVLITEWPMLRRWLEDNKALRGFTHELRQATRQWAARGRPADLVWRGQTAQEALSVSNRHLLDLSAAERDFLAAVRAQVTRARRRKVYGFTAAFIVLGLVIGGGTIAVVRISAAEKVASQKAKDAEQQLAATLEATQKKTEAEKKQSAAEKTAAEKELVAATASKDLDLSREALQKKNAELEHAIAEAKSAQVKAERAAKEAALAAETARKATEAEKASSAQLKLAVEREKANVRKLEAEKSKIATSLKESGGGGLK